MFHTVFYASCISQHLLHTNLLNTQTPTMLSKKAEDEQENMGNLEKENLERSRKAETGSETETPCSGNNC